MLKMWVIFLAGLPMKIIENREILERTVSLVEGVRKQRRSPWWPWIHWPTGLAQPQRMLQVVYQSVVIDGPSIGGFHGHGGTPKNTWMVYFIKKNNLEMDDN